MESLGDAYVAGNWLRRQEAVSTAFVMCPSAVACCTCGGCLWNPLDACFALSLKHASRLYAAVPASAAGCVSRGEATGDTHVVDETQKKIKR